MSIRTAPPKPVVPPKPIRVPPRPSTLLLTNESPKPDSIDVDKFQTDSPKAAAPPLPPKPKSPSNKGKPSDPAFSAPSRPPRPSFALSAPTSTSPTTPTDLTIPSFSTASTPSTTADRPLSSIGILGLNSNEGKYSGRGLLEIPEIKSLTAIQVANAFIRSEECYLKLGLQCVSTEFENRLNAHIKLGRPILAQEDVQRLFLNISNIYDFNRQLYSELEILQSSGEEALLNNLGNVMTKYIPFFKLYQKYVEKQRETSQLLSKFKRKDERFQDFVKINELCTGQELGVLLSAPVMRLPQYLMFLGGVHAKLERNSPGSQSLEEAIRSIQVVADNIAQRLKENKARNLCTRVQTEVFKGVVEVVSPTRYANKIGDLDIIGERAKGKGRAAKRQKHVFVLFNDCILFGLIGGALSKTAPKGVVRLNGLTIAEVEDDIKSSVLHAFELRHSHLGGALLVAATSPEERTKWTAAISKAISDFASQKQSSVRETKAISDDDFEVQICKKKLKRDYYVQPITSGVTTSGTSSTPVQTPIGTTTVDSTSVNAIWLKKFDDNSGYYYYENQETGESSWEPPAGWIDDTPSSTTSIPPPQTDYSTSAQTDYSTSATTASEAPEAPPMDTDAPTAPPPDDIPLAPDPTAEPQTDHSGSGTTSSSTTTGGRDRASSAGGGDARSDLLSAIRGAGGLGALKSAAKRVPPPMRSTESGAPRGAPPKPDLQATLQKSLANYRQFVQDDKDDKDDEETDWE